MSYAIIGFGAIGQALARAFARKNIEVAVASRRPPEALLPQAQAIGSTVVPKTLQEAMEAEVIFLAVLFEGHREVAKTLSSWQGKTVVDAMNGFEGLSSADVAKAFPGARFVKGFNHLPARTLAADPNVKGSRRVVFLSSDDEAAAARVADLAEQLGFAPVNLGKLEEGGTLVQVRDKSWAPLIFQDLFKNEPERPATAAAAS
ncbi:NADP oxidoreductase coenzyme [Rhodanobacter glycinis]|uniref:NADP oxidoreductase coenzyme n=1 Tax=Rhodanobacter glycinis TaxID=582702 RepID=A0A502BWU0_9GAMM|nr:NAD(P)-binding domain-containing protein [Rhodanobacter glycinis]TPG04942.1 NADP oxidoreductase coenzyme [Rhodanobacter glycinis]TPG50305.1 NADP oxidoreductase coenzyme [Rhodanobacter glycinis]